MTECCLQVGGIARRVVQKAGAEPTALLHALDSLIGRQPRVSGGNNRQVRLDALVLPLHDGCEAVSEAVLMTMRSIAGTSPASNRACPFGTASARLPPNLTVHRRSRCLFC